MSYLEFTVLIYLIISYTAKIAVLAILQTVLFLNTLIPSLQNIHLEVKSDVEVLKFKRL